MYTVDFSKYEFQMKYMHDISLLKKAAMGNKAVVIAYTDMHGVRSMRNIKPTAVYVSNHRYYLAAQDLDKDEPRVFKLDSIWAMTEGYELPMSDEEKAFDIFRADLTNLGVDLSLFTFVLKRRDFLDDDITFHLEAISENDGYSFYAWINKSKLDNGKHVTRIVAQVPEFES